MSTLRDAIAALREALRLSDKVDEALRRLQEVSREVRDHDRRITRLEAQWDTAIQLTRGRQLPP